MKALVRAIVGPVVYAAASKVKCSIVGEKTYHDHALDMLSKYRSIRGASVLVVGANDGTDCRRVIQRGADRVHGLDVLQKTGTAFRHPRVAYSRESIEECSLPSNSFDIAFAVATFEHVPDITAGWREMLRILKPGGTLFSVAAPLWESRYGHHMGCFEGHPWLHLALDRPAILAYSARNGITGERGHSVDSLLDYIFEPANFNMRPAADYLDAAGALEGATLARNDMDKDDPSLLEHPLGQLAISKGYAADSLLSVTHTLIAKRVARPDSGAGRRAN